LRWCTKRRATIVASARCDGLVRRGRVDRSAVDGRPAEAIATFAAAS
jgi:hypothetical protein